MKFTVVVHSAPFSQQGSTTALQFCQSLLAQGHHLDKVFFYADGVQNATHLLTPPEDEIHLQQRWCELANQFTVPLYVCVAAALRRGIVNEEEATRWKKAAFNLAEPFQLTGLGELSEAILQSDRVVNFGN